MSEKNRRYLLYFTGSAIGAVVGIIAAYIMDQNEQFDNENTGIQKKKLSKLGMGTISMLWSLIERGK